MAKRTMSRRELIDTGRNRMFAKRDAKGCIREIDSPSRELQADHGHR
jgi:hypothetical protein